MLVSLTSQRNRLMWVGELYNDMSRASWLWVAVKDRLYYYQSLVNVNVTRLVRGGVLIVLL